MTLLLFPIHGEWMTSDQYMERYKVSYLRAIHEINAIVNAESIRSAASAGALGTPKATAGDIGGATDDEHPA
jgi:hypothetical protein